MNKLEEAANTFASLETLSEYENSLCVSSFIAGAEWQKENMWNTLSEKKPDKEITIDGIETGFSTSTIVLTEDNYLYIAEYIFDKNIWIDTYLGKRISKKIIKWMPIPEIRKVE